MLNKPWTHARVFSVAIIIFFVYQGLLTGQNLRGRCLDKTTQEPLIGATIQWGTSAGTITNLDGYFSIPNMEAPLVISISYVGYRSIMDTIAILSDSSVQIFYLSRSTNLLQTATVTASRYDQPLAESTVSLDVLDQSLIENINATSADEALEKIPGVQVIGGQANIRGGSGFSYGAGSRVMLLVDDLPMLTADAAFPNWDDLPVENIQQVEVLKGSSSALYGSSALNGIINVRTSFPAGPPKTKISTFYTVFGNPRDKDKKWWSSPPGTYGLSATHSRKINKFDVVGGLYYLHRKPVYEDTYLNYFRAHWNTLYRITDRISISLNGNINRGKGKDFFYWQNHQEGAYRGAENTDNETDRIRFNIDPILRIFQKNGIRHKVLSRFYSINNRLTNNRSNQTSSTYLEYQINKDITEWAVELTGGAVYHRAAVQAELYSDTTFTYQNTSVYIQAQKKFGERFILNIGGRYENYRLNAPAMLGSIQIDPSSNQESRPVFRIGVNYQLSKATFLRASWGQGFRFPTIAEKFIQTNLGSTQISPNPNLHSEYGWSGEMGIKQGIQFKGWEGFVDLSGFWSEYFDMMEFVFASFNTGFMSLNIGDTRIAGFEGSIAGRSTIGEWPINILAGYTYIDPTFQNFTEEDQLRSSVDYNILKYRSKHLIKFDLETGYQNFTLGAVLNYVSHMEAIDAIFELVIPGLKEFRTTHMQGYALLNLRLGYDFERFKVSLLGNNLLNQEYSARPGLLNDPINWTFKVSTDF